MCVGTIHRRSRRVNRQNSSPTPNRTQRTSAYTPTKYTAYINQAYLSGFVNSLHEDLALSVFGHGVFLIVPAEVVLSGRRGSESPTKYTAVCRNDPPTLAQGQPTKQLPDSKPHTTNKRIYTNQIYCLHQPSMHEDLAFVGLPDLHIHQPNILLTSKPTTYTPTKYTALSGFVNSLHEDLALSVFGHGVFLIVPAEVVLLAHGGAQVLRCVAMHIYRVVPCASGGRLCDNTPPRRIGHRRVAKPVFGSVSSRSAQKVGSPAAQTGLFSRILRL